MTRGANRWSRGGDDGRPRVEDVLPQACRRGKRTAAFQEEPTDFHVPAVRQVGTDVEPRSVEITKRHVFGCGDRRHAAGVTCVVGHQERLAGVGDAGNRRPQQHVTGITDGPVEVLGPHVPATDPGVSRLAHRLHFLRVAVPALWVFTHGAPLVVTRAGFTVLRRKALVVDQRPSVRTNHGRRRTRASRATRIGTGNLGRNQGRNRERD